MPKTKLARPPYDPELVPALTVLAETIPATITPDLIETIRARSAAGQAAAQEDLSRGGSIELEERTVPGPDGAPDISLLIGRPAGLSTPVAGIYHTHGGGMIVGDNRTLVGDLLDWALEFGAVVVSVEYRLAPEHPDPAPIEDCYAGLVWTAEHAIELGIDPERLLIAGTSAGGGLAAGTALMARDRGGPALFGQLLMQPMLDDRMRTHSSLMLDGEATWDSTSNRTGWTALLGDRRGGPDVSVYAAPGRATDLSGLPPAFIDIGSVDTFRDEAVAYAGGIWQAGGSAELHVWPGGYHGFNVLAPQAALSKATHLARTDWLRRTLGA
ncbi:alpha/beta hydrolase [Streptomyces phaeochromogenes]|uniref:alpha/beta hydrolase n=1 Tax=Streptomyces phaeochromogenes TaxID=1923 RepID=UPI002DDA928D|nr:alpha/beta hydrolase [Streptomyces phaeochromogenes]WRZ34553.1 alpha/beta hydrolase [Streptomyces phaeochromogenes]